MNISGYSIKEPIGKGGMAVVYRAVQESLNRPVALKVMNPLYSDFPEFSERFLEEGRLLASLTHTNIIGIHDVGISDGLHFICMEYVQGGDLCGRIRAGISPAQATQYLKSLASCLSIAHDAHIVHRDIKPANVLFRKDGTLLLTDFGIAKQLTADKGLTMTGSMIGSPHYLSPEQVKGGAVDGRADIYSLGIIYYEMLTRKRPFTGDSEVNIALKHLARPMPKLPKVFAAYRGIIDRMTRKNPEERFPSCRSLLEALSELELKGAWSGEVLPLPLPTPQEPGVLKVGAGCGRHQDESRASSEPTRVSGNIGVEVMRGDATLVLNPATPGEVLDTKISPAPSVQQSPVHGPNSRKRWILGGGIAVAALLTILIGSQHYSKSETVISGRTSAVHAQPEVGSAITENRTEERLAREEAEQQAREKLERQAREEAEQRMRAKQERQAREMAEQKMRARKMRQALNKKIDVLVRNAEVALADYRLTKPEADNAYGYYRQVLVLDPKNPDARRGLLVIVDTYYELARRAESRWDYDRAKRYVDSGLQIKPRDGRLLQLRTALAKEDTTERTIKNSLKGIKGIFD